MECEEILSLFCDRNAKLWVVLLTHSRCVADLAVSVARAHPELAADEQFVYEAAMLHDVGIVRTDAPNIFCYGHEPYLRHGVIGHDLLLAQGLPRHALVCERHTGAGLSLLDIERDNLPLPHRDLMPVSTEEKIVCYADKFYSKSRRLTERKSYTEALNSVAKFGEPGRLRFEELDKMLRIKEIEP